MVSSDGFLSNMVSRDKPYSQKILEISLPHRFLSQNNRKMHRKKGMHGKDPRKFSLLLGRSFGRRVLLNVTLRTLRHVEPIFNEIVSLAKIRGVEMDSNDIDALVEELTTEELMELNCVSQQEVMEESFSEEEEVTAKQRSSSAIREMLEVWETIASYIEKHHTNKVVAMRTTNLFHDNAVPQFRQILKRRRR
ncbi:hypothetical protein AVEN_54099-1 [Araneus ventricosus]|uniref:DDE-1 domain-containing protein n=1 Tax=Araneus ventricosus TaxID=182803 RepID=A0A4Y2BTF4_ARAVE|nr:hypothetical protein AVEN_54099-1 [Araneus ventricosus]